MSESNNDNLSGAAPATGTPANNTQAVSGAPAQLSTTTTTAAGESSSTTAPELILGKFKSPDDLAKAYKELEQKQGEMSSYKNIAETLDKYAKAKGTSVEEFKQRMAEELEQEEMKAAGIDNPVVYKMQKELQEMKQQQKVATFEGEFAQIVTQYPALAQTKESLRNLFMASSYGKTLGQIVSEVYAPVIESVEQQAVQRLGEKAAANALSPRIGDTAPVLNAQQLEELRLNARNSTADAAAYLEAKRRLQK